jgi:hypothetical protein
VSNITLPRAVAEMMFNALLDRIHGRYAATQEDEIALAALDAALAEPEQKPEPATVEQIIAASGPPWALSATPDFFTGFRAAERFHGIGGSK